MIDWPSFISLRILRSFLPPQIPFSFSWCSQIRRSSTKLYCTYYIQTDLYRTLLKNFMLGGKLHEKASKINYDRSPRRMTVTTVPVAVRLLLLVFVVVVAFFFHTSPLPHKTKDTKNRKKKSTQTTRQKRKPVF